MPPPRLRSIDPKERQEKESRKNFSAFDNHLKDPKSRKSKNLQKIQERFAQDPAVRNKNFKADFKSEEGIELQIGSGPIIDKFYEQNGYINLNNDVLKGDQKTSWSDQEMFVKMKKKSRVETRPSDVINQEMIFTWTKDPSVKMSCKISKLFILPKRATGMASLSDVSTFR